MLQIKKNVTQFPFILFFMAALTTIEASGNNLSDSIPKGWQAGPNNPADIIIGTDTTVRHSGKASGFVQCALALKPSTGNVVMWQSIAPDPYRNKRVRLTAYARSIEIESEALFYFRVDGTDTVLAYARTIPYLIEETTDWTLYHITLDVPVAAISLDFGVVMTPGQGIIWVDDFNLAVVDNLIQSDAMVIPGQSKNPGTRKNSISNAKAMNLGFEDR